MLLRVFNLRDGSGGVKKFPNTWALFMNGALNFRSTDKYVVIDEDARDAARL